MTTALRMKPFSPHWSNINHHETSVTDRKPVSSAAHNQLYHIIQSHPVPWPILIAGFTTSDNNRTPQSSIEMPTYKVAVPQWEPVWLDKAATTRRVIELIQEAASQGARLVAFGELVS